MLWADTKDARPPDCRLPRRGTLRRMSDAGPTKSPTKNPVVDAFIKQAAPFAKPILTKLRRLIHKAAPGCREVIEWGMPAFDYHGPFVSISAFKAHCVVKKKPARAVPPTMLAAIRNNPAAKATWEGFSPSHQREYIEWITEAKKDATRERRMSQKIEQLADGKSRHWRYQ